MEKSLLIAGFVAVFGVQLCSGSPLELMENDDSSRIINGNIASENQFPYAISLQLISSQSQVTRGHTCGGVLVTLGYAVTSGRCLYTGNSSPYTLKVPSDYRVFAGSAQLTNDSSVDRWRSISSMSPHPDYPGPPSNLNDIGVITLATAFLSIPGLAPLSISTNTPADGALCTVAGWGAATVGGASSSSLMFASRYTVNQTICSLLSSAYNGPSIQPYMICAQFSNSFSPSCTNDNGNALVCGGDLVGVLSWYPACGVAHNTEVYTRTASFAEWVSSVTGAASSLAPALTSFFLTAAVLTHVLN